MEKRESIEKRLSNVKTIEELRELCKDNQAEVEALLDKNSCYKSMISLHQKLTGLPDSSALEQRLMQLLFNVKKRFNDVLKEYMFSVYDKAEALEKELDESKTMSQDDEKALTELGIILEKCHDKLITKKKKELKIAAKKENSPDLKRAVANLCSNEAYLRKQNELCRIEGDTKDIDKLEEEYDFIKPFSSHFGNSFTIRSSKVYTRGFEFKDLFFADNIQKIKLPQKIEYGITREKTENTEIALVEIIIPDFEQYKNGISFAWYNSSDKTIFVNNTELANFVGSILDKIENKNGKLLCKEFENSSLEEVYDKVFFETAIHELGHQANDLSYYFLEKHSEWQSIDDERFSKLCELIYGKVEYLSLHNILHFTNKDKYKSHHQANESIKLEIFNILANNKTQYQKINYDNLKEKTEDELVKLSRQEIRQIATQIMEKFEEERKEHIRTGFENVPGSRIYTRKMELAELHKLKAPRLIIANSERDIEKYKKIYKKIYEKIYGPK